MKEPSKEQIKERAKFLRQVLREKHEIDLPHGHSLEVLAKVFGFKDWNTASALSLKADDENPVDARLTAESNTEKPIAAKFQTIGEIMDFFSKFDRGAKLVVSEYSGSSGLEETITSFCSLTYDREIQNGTELRLELNTEDERNEGVTIGGRSSATQSFDITAAGRSQRRIKYLHMLKGFWNPGAGAGRSDRKS